MNNSTIKYKGIILMVMIFFIFGTPGSAASNDNNKGDILVHLRLYEGSRGNEVQKSSVVSSYYLKPLVVSNMVSELDIIGEQKELKRLIGLLK